MTIIETERLVLRELNSDTDAVFILELLNTPKFIQYIGDRGVRSVEESAAFIENRYRQSYRDHGFGLYAVVLKDGGSPVGICGFVKRDTLTYPDIGFAFLPEFERLGFGFEAAAEILYHGRETLGFSRVFAITSQDNEASVKLLDKLGFTFDRLLEMPDGDTVKLFKSSL